MGSKSRIPILKCKNIKDLSTTDTITTIKRYNVPLRSGKNIIGFMCHSKSEKTVPGSEPILHPCEINLSITSNAKRQLLSINKELDKEIKRMNYKIKQTSKELQLSKTNYSEKALQRKNLKQLHLRLIEEKEQLQKLIEKDHAALISQKIRKNSLKRQLDFAGSRAKSLKERLQDSDNTIVEFNNLIENLQKEERLKRDEHINEQNRKQVDLKHLKILLANLQTERVVSEARLQCIVEEKNYIHERYDWEIECLYSLIKAAETELNDTIACKKSMHDKYNNLKFKLSRTGTFNTYIHNCVKKLLLKKWDKKENEMFLFWLQLDTAKSTIASVKEKCRYFVEERQRFLNTLSQMSNQHHVELVMKNESAITDIILEIKNLQQELMQQWLEHSLMSTLIANLRQQSQITKSKSAKHIIMDTKVNHLMSLIRTQEHRHRKLEKKLAELLNEYGRKQMIVNNTESLILCYNLLLNGKQTTCTQVRTLMILFLLRWNEMYRTGLKYKLLRSTYLKFKRDLKNRKKKIKDRKLEMWSCRISKNKTNVSEHYIKFLKLFGRHFNFLKFDRQPRVAVIDY